MLVLKGDRAEGDGGGEGSEECVKLRNNVVIQAENNFKKEAWWRKPVIQR